MANFYPFPESFENVPAGELKVGDRTRFSYGRNVTVRTVSSIQKSRGIVRVQHRETDARFWDEWGETYKVHRLKPGQTPVDSAFDT